MNLRECLRAVEYGTSGKEHADWLRTRIKGNVEAGATYFEQRNSARLWRRLWKRAAKNYRERWMVQDALADIGHAAQLVWMGRTREARDWAIRLKRELDECKAAYDLLREQLRKSKTEHRFETGTLRNELAGVQYALENWRRRALSAEEPPHSCETCRHFHANTYICRAEWAPLKCVLNYYSEWEARE